MAPERARVPSVAKSAGLASEKSLRRKRPASYRAPLLQRQSIRAKTRFSRGGYGKFAAPCSADAQQPVSERGFVFFRACYLSCSQRHCKLEGRVLGGLWIISMREASSLLRMEKPRLPSIRRP